MITHLIKHFVLYYFCIFICNKSLHLRKFSTSLNISIAIILSILTHIININLNNGIYAIPLLLLWVTISIYNTHPKITFAAITISFSISYSIHIILSFFIAILSASSFETDKHFPIFAIIVGILQLIIVKLLFKTKRLRNGIPFLSSSIHINCATLLGIILITFSLYMSDEYTSFHQRFSGILSFIASSLALAFLIYWWQAQITKAYRRNLELRELESMRTEMAELKLMIKKLVDENERLAKITHRDNTLISALKNSTVKYLSTDFANPTVAMEVRKQLIENIESLSAGRNSLLEHTHEKSVRTFDTGLPLLDELLREMDASAAEHGIVFSVHMGTSLGDFIPSAVSESDLVHTADDLLKNAFKSTLTREKRIVQLQFYKLGKHLVIEVADTGIPFEIKSLVNMGVEKYTTYADGSGIGLMDIWSTKEKYGATYHLDEYENGAPFAKKISLTFDKKNRYSIRTWRKEEILQVSRRTDLQVYDYSENI